MSSSCRTPPPTPADSLVVVFPGQVFDGAALAGSLHEFLGHPALDQLAACIGTDRWSDIDATDPAVAGPCTLVAGLLTATAHIDRSRVAAVAGHSFGEITASAYAGSLGLDDALRIVATRGRACRDTSRARAGAMVAVMGVPPVTIEWARRLAIGATGGVCEIGAINDRSQVTLTGDRRAIDDVVTRLAPTEAILAPLPIPGAFHSPIMAGAFEAMCTAVAGVPFSPLDVPLYSNVDARAHVEGGDLATLIPQGLVMPVRWHDVVTALVADGHRTFVEAGPGEALTKLGRRNRTLRFVRLADAGPPTTADPTMEMA